MQKLTQHEVDSFIDGINLIEILVDISDDHRVFNFLKKHGPFICTTVRTYKITKDTYKTLVEKGFRIKVVSGEGGAG